ncbi:MAG: hypothetical protein JWL71_1740 [Acidobacteria bacterium]|nr:hypothetical protein [Acidobacteriota bacterium]
MYGRGFDPAGQVDALYSLASILLFAWLLGAIGVFDAGMAAYIMLAAATVMVAVALLRRRV